ncbi:hypothetical protein QBC41DRAFT_224155, partial [Cercophora samala]
SAARTINGGISVCGVSEIVVCSAPCIFLLFSWGLQVRSSFYRQIRFPPCLMSDGVLWAIMRPREATPPGEVR